MSNDLATLSTNPVAINKAFGFAGRPKPLIPTLKINSDDDEDGTKAEKGTFVLDDGDKILYAKEVTVRSFLKAYQYRVFDKDDKTKNDSSIIANNFDVEFRSVSGKIACGKMGKKAYAALGDRATASQAALQKAVKCKLLVFGLVSGEFTDLDTKAIVKVEDALFVWVVAQSSFMVIDASIKGIEKERRPVPLTPIKLTLNKVISGKVTYFEPIPAVQNVTVPLVPERDQAYLATIQKFVKGNNDYVNQKYSEAHKGKVQSEDFKTVGQIIEGKVTPVNDMPNDPLDLE